MIKMKTSFAPIMAASALGIALGLALPLSGPAYAADAPGVAEESAPAAGPSFTVSGGVTFATDYAFRGFSQTGEDPAVQPWVEFGYGIWYLGVWGSNIDFGPGVGADVEIDIYGGVRPTWNNVSFDFGVIGYLYPDAGDPPGAEFDYVELKAGASVPVGEMVTLGATVFYSPEFFGETGDAVAVEGNVSVTLPHDFSVSALIGHQTIDLGTDYTYWNAGVSWSPKGFLTFDVRYHDTDIGGPGCAKLCDERVIASASLSFSSN